MAFNKSVVCTNCLCTKVEISQEDIDFMEDQIWNWLVGQQIYLTSLQKEELGDIIAACVPVAQPLDMMTYQINKWMDP